MSAMVCGKRIERSFLEDLPTTPYLSKRFRRSSPIRLSPSRSPTTTTTTTTTLSSSSSPTTDFNNNGSSTTTTNVDAVHHLSGLFPDIDKEVLGRTLEECGNDLDATIKSLNEICLNANTDSIKNNGEQQSHGIASTSGEALYSENPSAPDNLPKSGSEWVELLVSEMTNSSNMDDARARASRVLGILEKSIRANASAEAATNFQMENPVLKEQMQVLLRENTILKRAVAIQHKQQKQHDDRNQELQQLKQLVSQYQEQLRTLEVNNYALTMHLRQAEQSSSIPGRFHPDIF